MNWTPERVERAKALAKDGYSASQIAAELGGVSRNAVIGILHRKGIGLARRTKAGPAMPTHLSAGQVETIRAMWADGVDARQIGVAAQCSREAVYQAARALGLPSRSGDNMRAESLKRSSFASRRAPSGAVALRSGRSAATPDAPALPPLNLPLEDLSAGQCKWPEGDGPFAFCGQPIAAAPSSILTACYCPHHGRQAVATEQQLRMVAQHARQAKERESA